MAKKPARKPTTPNARLLFEQGFELHRLGRSGDAFARYEAALAVHPRHAQALHLSGLLLHQAGRSAEALDRVERALSVDDGVSDAWSNAGLIYEALGRPTDAVRAFERAVALEPGHLEAWSNLASTRLSLDEPVAAEHAARRSLVAGSSIGGWFNLALALSAQRRPQDVLATLIELEALHGADASGRPGLAAAIAGLRGQALLMVDQPDAARRVLDAALASGDHPTLRLERARLAEAARDEPAAMADYAAALQSDACDETTREMALSEIIFLRKHWAAWDGLGALQASFRERVVRHAERGDASALTPFTFLSDPSTRAEQRAASEGWARRFRLAPPTTRALSTGLLRIGYLSADLHDHATGILAAGLFERHDRSRFEVFAYSTGLDDGSALRRRLVAAFDRFVDAREWSDARIAEAIAADGTDILVDLKGHTEQATTGVLALRPAPIAVSYLGYPGTMGGSLADYLIGDAIVTPLAEAGDYSETLVQVPGCYQVNDDRRVAAEITERSSLGLPDDAVVLCSFNSTYKVNPPVYDAWAKILARAPRAVLWLQARGDLASTRERLLRQMTSRGIAEGRVRFADNLPHARYLGLYRHADLFLDTWPYNAHTTASDALWSGCPVLTVRGATFAGRVAESVLRAAGFDDGVAVDIDDYIERAVRWANDPATLAGFRTRLETGARSSALFDTAATTRAIEAAYLAMRDQYLAGTKAPIVIA